MSRDASTIPQLDEEELRKHVLDGLDKLKRDEMFVHSGPESHDFPKLLDKNGNPPRIESEGHPFNRFLHTVALFIAQSKGKGHSKKVVKAFAKQLQSARDLWPAEIQNYKDSPMKASPRKKPLIVVPKESTKGKKKRKKSNSNKEPIDNDDIEDETKTKKVNQKKLKKEKGFSKAFLQREHEKMKEQFEQIKEETLAEIPKDYSSWFHQIGFAKWGKCHYPVMFIGPYDIGPCEARNIWAKMFEKTGEEDRRHNMSRLVYWYGAEGNTQFSLVAKNSCVLYEQGLKKGFDKPWKSLQKKMEDGKKLNKKDEETFKKWQEMEEDLERVPKDRFPPDQMKEDHDALLDGDLDLVEMYGNPEDVDMEESDDEELIDDEDDMEESPPKKRKPGRPKKKKDDESSIDDGSTSNKKTPGRPKKKKETNDDADLEETPPKKKKPGRPKKQKGDESSIDDESAPVKKKPGRPKKKKEDAEVVEETLPKKKKPGRPKKSKGENAETKTKKRKKKSGEDDEVAKSSKKKKKKKKNEEESVVGHVDEEDFAEHEESSNEAVDYEEEEDEEAIVSDADSADHDYAPEVKKKKKQKTTKKKTKEAGKKKKTSEDSKELKKKNKLFKQEQEAFEYCENEYLHHFNNMEEYIEVEDTAKLEITLRKILRIVDDLTAPFIQTYNIAIIMKDRVKPFIAAKKGKKDPLYVLYKEVFSKMGSVFKEKFEKIPEGFEPKKTWKKPAEESPRPSSPQETKLPEAAELNLPLVKKGNGTKAVSDDVVKSPTSSRPPSRAGQSILAATKTVRKAFSLGNLMRPKHMESQLSASADGRLRTTAAAPEKKEAPSWLMKSPENYPSTHTNEDRKYAFEFYESLSAGFPDQKVDRQSLAKNLELAVFEWSQEQERDGWVDKYWEKTHSLVAAVRGKWGTGGLIVHKILKGNYATPRDVVLLPDHVLEWSFDGSS